MQAADSRKIEYNFAAESDTVSVPVSVYRVVVHQAKDVGGYWAKCDMQNGGCVVQGDTVQETQKNMLEAMEMYLEDYPEASNYALDFVIENA